MALLLLVASIFGFLNLVFSDLVLTPALHIAEWKITNHNTFYVVKSRGNVLHLSADSFEGKGVIMCNATPHCKPNRETPTSIQLVDACQSTHLPEI